MVIILEQLFFLYIFIFVGYLCGKRKTQLLSHTGILSFLAVNLFLPAKVFGSFSANFTLSYFRDHYGIIIVSVALLVVLHFLGKLTARLLKSESHERSVYEYSVTISNYAYMGYALAEGLFGSQMLTDMILFCIPFSLYTYTVGYAKLTGGNRGIKRLISPMNISIVLGMIVGLTGLTVPDFLRKIVTAASACVGPVSMLLTGLTLAAFPLRQLLCDKKVYIMAALRLVLLPLLVLTAFKLLRLETLLPVALLMAAMPTGLNTIIFPENVGRSPELGAKLALVSHALSCITLPIWLTVL